MTFSLTAHVTGWLKMHRDCCHPFQTTLDLQRRRRRPHSFSLPSPLGLGPLYSLASLFSSTTTLLDHRSASDRAVDNTNQSSSTRSHPTPANTEITEDVSLVQNSLCSKTLRRRGRYYHDAASATFANTPATRFSRPRASLLQ